MARHRLTRFIIVSRRLAYKLIDPRMDISIWRRSVYKTLHLFKQYLLSLSLRGTNNLQSVQ